MIFDQFVSSSRTAGYLSNSVVAFTLLTYLARLLVDPTHPSRDDFREVLGDISTWAIYEVFPPLRIFPPWADFMLSLVL